MHAYWLASDAHRCFSAHARAPWLSLTQKYSSGAAGCVLAYFIMSIIDKRCPRYSRWPWDLQTTSFSYGSRYVAHAKTPPVWAQYNAAHSRHGLASDTAGCGLRFRGFLMNMCSGTASAGGLVSAIITAARHISISNRADGVARAVRYCVALPVIAFICAMKRW
jgi:hypothetical protein